MKSTMADMNTNELFTDLAHRPLDAAQNLPPLTAEQLNAHPGDHPNSVAWLLWHSGREVDVQLADLNGKEQQWENYRDSFNLGDLGDAVGLGHTPEQAAQIQVGDQKLLIDYLAATINALTEYAGGLSEEEFGEVIDDNWDPPVTRGARLVSIVDDAAQHVGQAAYAAGILTQ